MNVEQACQAWPDAIALPRLYENGADFDEARSEPFDTAQADRVLVEARGDAHAIAKRQAMPREGIGRYVGNAIRQAKNCEAG